MVDRLDNATILTQEMYRQQVAAATRRTVKTQIIALRGDDGEVAYHSVTCPPSEWTSVLEQRGVVLAGTPRYARAWLVDGRLCIAGNDETLKACLSHEGRVFTTLLQAEPR